MMTYHSHGAGRVAERRGGSRGLAGRVAGGDEAQVDACRQVWRKWLTAGWWARGAWQVATVLVATSLAARGLDVKDLNLVVRRDAP
jgi:hypothetical protein